jgi:hypothetical protein
VRPRGAENGDKRAFRAHLCDLEIQLMGLMDDGSLWILGAGRAKRQSLPNRVRAEDS